MSWIEAHSEVMDEEGRVTKPAFTDEDGHVYTGQWLNGKRDGIGKVIIVGGDCYEGEWKNGLMHGYGCYKWENG